jgi:hypothetical protein
VSGIISLLRDVNFEELFFCGWLQAEDCGDIESIWSGVRSF